MKRFKSLFFVLMVVILQSAAVYGQATTRFCNGHIKTVGDTTVLSGPIKFPDGTTFSTASHIGGNFTDTNDQVIVLADTPQSITFNQNRLIDDIGHTVSSDTFTVNTNGVYQLMIAPQLGQGSGAAMVEFWIEKNGVDIVDSNIQLTVVANSQTLPFLRWKERFVATDIFKIIWASDSANTKLDKATSLFGGPIIPSIMLGVTHIGS